MRGIVTSNAGIDFDDAYRTYFQLVYKVCLGWTRNPADAEEMTQETFLWACRYERFFNAEKWTLAQWLCQAARQRCIYHWQRHAAKVSRASESEGVLVEHPAMAADPLDKIAINEALRQVPERYKRSMMLRNIWGLEPPEIAAVLNISSGTATKQAFRGRERMRQILGVNA